MAKLARLSDNSIKQSMKYHIITPFARFENLRKIIDMLAPKDVSWHPIMDEDLPFRFRFDQFWIVPSYCPVIQGPFWSKWRHAINWFLDTSIVYPTDRWCILNDDDFYEPDFFEKITTHKADVVIASMKRGHHIPPVTDPVRAHPTSTLIAAPENMVPCGVGIEQMIVSGRILSGVRLEDNAYADGMLISSVVKNNEVDYAPEAFVWFNYLEPGRWDHL